VHALDASLPVRHARTTERKAFLFHVFWLVFAGYYLGARVGFALTFLPNPISVLWPPNAILFAAMLLVAPRFWWVVVIAALPAHLLAELQAGVPVFMVLCWFISNVTEAVIGATCVRLLTRGAFTLDTLRNISAFLGAAIVASFLSSFLDSAFVVLNGWGQSDYWKVWQTRLLSNVTSSYTFAPVIVTWYAAGFAHLRSLIRTQLAELGAFTAGLLIVTLVVFDWSFIGSAVPALIYVPLPFLLWAALRFGPVGASTCFAIVAFMVIWGTGHGHGPFGTQLPAQNALSVQLFLIFMGPTLLCLAAAMQERLRAEQSLRASDRRFQLVLQATKDVVYERDLRTDVMWWGRNGLAPFGYPREHCPVTFAATLELVHPEDRERAVRSLAATIESGEQLWESEFRLRRSDGSYAHVHEHGFVVRGLDGQLVQMVGTLTDITERRDNDELSQRLAQASRLITMGELTACIAHEINQPMSAILSNVDAAEMLLDAGDNGSDELRQILRDIRADDLRASEVIRHIRELANKRAIATEQFDPNALVRDVLQLVAATMKRRGVTVRAVFGRVPLVCGDRICVQQVLLNLLFNGMEAVSALPERERRLQVTTRVDTPGEVMMSVRDRGHGIAPHQLDQIFESFFTTKKDGLGLGLSIARSLVEANGGMIWAENNVDRGATFHFTLRADKPTGGPDESIA
jgi:two-component system sensor kinase FixL